jgi:cyclic pyranopterin phosphate synthase
MSAKSSITLRVSVLETCQLNCRYCLPSLNPPIPQKNWMTLEQYEDFAAAATSFNISKVRFTGGEPLLRRELASIIKIFATHLPGSARAVTTNGLLFERCGDKLVNAGLNNITFHLDTLKAERYPAIMGPGSPEQVFTAIGYAQSLGLCPKVNVVVQNGVNTDELGAFLCWSQKAAVQVRFIELMNTGSARGFVAKHFISGQDILGILQERFSITAVGRHDPHAAAEEFLVGELGVNFGLIASDTRPFCHSCNRLRLSVTGNLRGCLYEPAPEPLVFHDGSVNAQILHRLQTKRSFHPSTRLNADFSMSQIGG